MGPLNGLTTPAPRTQTSTEVCTLVVTLLWSAIRTLTGCPAACVAGKIKYESSECTLLKYSFGVYALDNSQGTALHPLVGDTVSFRLFASDV